MVLHTVGLLLRFRSAIPIQKLKLLVQHIFHELHKTELKELTSFPTNKERAKSLVEANALYAKPNLSLRNSHILQDPSWHFPCWTPSQIVHKNCTYGQNIIFHVKHMDNEKSKV